MHPSDPAADALVRIADEIRPRRNPAAGVTLALIAGLSLVSTILSLLAV